MKIDYTELDARVEALKEELIRDIRSWVSVPSVKGEAMPGKPYGEENARMLDLALATARGYGFATRNIDYYAGDVTLGEGEETMGILAHLDVVPAGEGWTHAPFGGEIADGRIYGRGSIDDKGPALCALHAMRAVRDARIPLRHAVRLILGCDEETGMSDMVYYASHAKMPDYGFSPDASFPLINIEKGGLNIELLCDGAGEEGAEIPVYEISAGQRPNVVPAFARAVVGTQKLSCEDLGERIRSRVPQHMQRLQLRALEGGRAELTAEGVLAHGSLPEQGVNAACILLTTLHAIGAGGGVRPALRMAAEKLGPEPDGASLGIRCEDELSHNLSCNLGIVRWDGKHFSAVLDIRYPLCANEADLTEKIASAVAPYGATVRKLSGHPPLHVPAEHRVVRGLLQVYNELTGEHARPLAIGGGTYSQMMPNTVAFGIAFPDQEDCCHIADEYIDIGRMMQATRIYAHAIAELAGGNFA